jgi:hypothetical protein
MDKIDIINQKMLILGGNKRFNEFLKIYEIKNNDENKHLKYFTKAAELYRKILVEGA